MVGVERHRDTQGEGVRERERNKGIAEEVEQRRRRWWSHRERGASPAKGFLPKKGVC